MMKKYKCKNNSCNSISHWFYASPEENKMVVKCKGCDLVSIFAFEKHIEREVVTSNTLSKIIKFLDINQGQLARYLNVNIRTVRRWFQDINTMPKAAGETLLAWEKLHKLGLNWRPDAIDLVDMSGFKYNKN